MNVLSLFDGMSCGQIALNRVGRANQGDAKKKKLFVDGNIIAKGRQEMVKWKKKVTKVQK